MNFPSLGAHARHAARSRPAPAISRPAPTCGKHRNPSRNTTTSSTMLSWSASTASAPSASLIVRHVAMAKAQPDVIAVERPIRADGDRPIGCRQKPLGASPGIDRSGQTAPRFERFRRDSEQRLFPTRNRRRRSGGSRRQHPEIGAAVWACLANDAGPCELLTCVHAFCADDQTMIFSEINRRRDLRPNRSYVRLNVRRS
jgi:hypothetical protein